MKVRYFILVIVLVFISGYKVQKKISIEGTWKLVSIKNVANDSVTTMDKNNIQSKMIYDNHFMFVGRFIADKDTIFSYGSGTYTLDGNSYKEKILYHSSHFLEGEEIPFEVTFKNDTLYQRGPLKSDNKDYGWDFTEMYVKE